MLFDAVLRLRLENNCTLLTLFSCQEWLILIIMCYRKRGWVAERFKAPVLKTDVRQRTVSSNLTPSAILKRI
jgi:hypothetical protein